jgi:hypothetical protein
MRLVLLTTALAIAPAMSPTSFAHAQGSLRNTSEASKQVIIAAGAIGESGIKASTGVVAIPLGGVALASGAVGAAANASGYTETGKGFQDASGGISKGARSLVEFSGEPLFVSDEVVLAKPAQPVAQPAPRVPYKPDQE